MPLKSAEKRSDGHDFGENEYNEINSITLKNEVYLRKWRDESRGLETCVVMTARP